MPGVTQAAGLVSAPRALESEIRIWVRPLVIAAGQNLRALYLYGSALSAEFDPAVSDVNLLFVVAELPFHRLAALASAYGSAVQGSPGRLRYSPVVLSEEQIRSSVDVFPLEFLDLAERRALLEGRDVLGGLQVDHTNLRHQCESELRSKLLGLRQAYLLSAGAPGTAQQLLAQAAGGSAALFRHLLTLRGERHPEDHRAVARAVAAVYGLDPDDLDAPFQSRRSAANESTATDRFARYLGALEQLIAAVDALSA
jgi:hypothetical protein